MQIELEQEKPARLYKYLDVARIDVLRNKQIRYTQPDALNDPFEAKPFIMALSSTRTLLDKWRIEDVAGKHDALGESVLHVTESLSDAQEASRRLADMLGMLCLSGTWESLVMWSHYCRGHEGFVIGLDPSHPCFDERPEPKDGLGHARAVKYRSERPSACLKELLRVDGFFVKSEVWSYEQEWRVLQPLKEGGLEPKNGDEDHDRHPIYLFPLPPAAVTQVIIGSRMVKERRSEIIGLIDTDPDYKHVDLFEAVPDVQEFRLRLVPLLDRAAPST